MFLIAILDIKYKSLGDAPEHLRYQISSNLRHWHSFIVTEETTMAKRQEHLLDVLKLTGISRSNRIPLHTGILTEV